MSSVVSEAEDFVVPPPPRPSLAVMGGSRRFPVRRIVCVGRNYASHAREMGSDPAREPPFFFQKPADAVVENGAEVPYPTLTHDFHHEIELVVAIGTGGREIPRDEALDHVFGYGVGIDLTRRDVQAAARRAGQPWDWAKGFDRSAPISALTPVSEIGHPARGRIWLAVDGLVRQDDDIGSMIWPVADVIAFASRAFELRPGDVFMTGTPAGVGPVVAGQVMTGGIAGVGEIRIGVTEGS